MTTTITWTGTITALSSIAHGGETKGVLTLLRRELIRQPDGTLLPVPIISGNSFRGVLRRVSEELLRDTLTYEGSLSLAAAHVLRGGGALTKAAREPLSGARLRTLRELIPHIGIFGTAAGGRIIDGALRVGKVVPYLAETAHLTGHAEPTSAFSATQLESYTRHDDTTDHAFVIPLTPDAPELSESDTQQMLYRLETFPAGTRFESWVELVRATDLEISYFAAVLDRFTHNARLGGRSARGHGRVRLDLTPSISSLLTTDWQTHLQTHRDQILTALEDLA